MYGSYKHFRGVRYEKCSYYGYFVAVKPFLTATFLAIAVSRDFCVFWILEAVVYGTNKHLEALVVRNGAVAGILSPSYRF